MIVLVVGHAVTLAEALRLCHHYFLYAPCAAIGRPHRPPEHANRARGGIDPVWLGIMMAVNLQTSYMHPPLGPTLFYLRGVAPPQITTRHIYWGIIPFVLIQVFALVVLWSVPGLATMLPHALYGS